MDAISQILQTFHLRTQVFHNAKYCGAFNVDTSAPAKAAFHVISAGRAVLVNGKDTASARELVTGDLVLFPRAGAHRIMDVADTAVDVNSTASLPFAEAADRPGTGLVCGYLEFDHPSSNPLLEVLPDCLLVKSAQPPWNATVGPLLEILVRESTSNGVGVQVTLNRLCDVVFVLLMREHLAQQTDTGLGAALSDKRIGQSLNALHASLDADWTVESLARVAAMSRAAFAARFKELLGVSPMAYLTRCRMQAAYRWLRDEREPVASVAARTGYATEAAFAKAFKRETGVSPGAVRRGEPLGLGAG